MYVFLPYALTRISRGTNNLSKKQSLECVRSDKKDILKKRVVLFDLYFFLCGIYILYISITEMILGELDPVLSTIKMLPIIANCVVMTRIWHRAKNHFKF